MRNWIGYRWDHQRGFDTLRRLKTALNECPQGERKVPREPRRPEGYPLGGVFEHSAQVPDPWGNPYQYRPEGDGYTLYSLGRDGKRGGEGLDEDPDVRDLSSHIVDRDPVPRVCIPTLWQFTFECPTGGR